MNLRVFIKGLGVALVVGAVTTVSVYEYCMQSTEDMQKISAANLLFTLGFVGSLIYTVTNIKELAEEMNAERDYIPWAERVRNRENRERG